MKNSIFWILIILMIGCSILIGYGLKKCNCDIVNPNVDKTDIQIIEEKYNELNNKLFEYLEDIYNNDKWMNGNVEPGIYINTLDDLKNKGYDISMFVNPITKEQCDLKKTYGRFIILGTTEDGKTDYTYDTYLICDEVLD